MILFLLVVTFQQANAFGGFGHQTVCEIAYMQLEPMQKKIVDDVIKKSQFTSFAQSCTYPDWNNSEPKKRKKNGDHYINLSRNATQITASDCEGICAAIQKDMDSLSDNIDEFNLAYLGHWLGDVHQPLHVSFKSDLGGNRVSTSKMDNCGANLHSMWDSCLPKADAQKQGISKPKDFAVYLLNYYKGQTVEQGDVFDWLNESFAITTAKNTQYCRWQNSSCVQNKNKIDALSYQQAQSEIAQQQIYKAGIRLGNLLNQLVTKPTGEKIANNAGANPWALLVILLFVGVKRGSL